MAVESKVPFKPISPNKASDEEIKKGLELLAKQRHTAERVKAGELKGGTGSYKKRSEMTPEELAKVKNLDKVYQAKNAILLRKAREQGIVVTEAEIDAYIASKSK